ncbi:MAG: YcaO-like family protein [Rikenellaceae bacterium]|nr:YcaO-like family protein [Rikenellaceae bacterium]
MKYQDYIGLKKGLRIISDEIGLLSYIAKLPNLNSDPNIISYGIWPCDTTHIGGLKYSGRSSGCGHNWEHAVLSTIGEVVERYCPAFYSKNDLIKSAYKNLRDKAVDPKEFALFHPAQYKQKDFPYAPFNEDHEIHWVKCKDLINGGEVLYPGSLIYMPWAEEEKYIALSTSTGLAGHTNLHEAILVGLYELIERDSFVLTWMQELITPKIVIDDDIDAYLKDNFPSHYNFHLFDIGFDLETPAVLGIMFGEAEFGKFVAVGSSARGTYADAVKKTVMEIGQVVGYYRYLLESRKNWSPTEFNEIMSFEDHSIFYFVRPELLHVFDKWTNAVPSKKIDFNERRKLDTTNEIKRILRVMDEKGYDVLFKDLTTPDVDLAGFHSIKVMIPQLIQMAGIYKTYFCGGKRLYEVPAEMGYQPKDYDNLNPYPHPFP